MTVGTLIEEKTAELFGDIHQLPEEVYVEAVRSKVLTSVNLGVAEDFLEGKTCLDAGTGGLGRALPGLCTLGTQRIAAVDLSPDNIASARKRNADIRRKVTYSVTSISNLPFRHHAFDFIHCSGVLVCIDDANRTLRELCRSLKPGGHLYVGLYGKGGLLYTAAGVARWAARCVPYELARGVLTKLVSGSAASNILDYLYAPIQHHYTEKEAEDFLRQAGLEQVRRLPQPPAYTRSIWHSLLKPSTYDPNSTLGKLVVGSGWIILMAQKPQLLGTDMPTAEPTLNGTNPL